MYYFNAGGFVLNILQAFQKSQQIKTSSYMSSNDVEDKHVDRIEEPESNSTQSTSTDPRTIAKPRAILNREQAIEIFQLRPSGTNEGFERNSLAVARTYKVSEKTVRDIWRARTWHRETLHLDPSRPARADTPPGRPLGRKDSAPRRRPAPRLSEIAKLPAAKDADDPFHDDWPNWDRADRSSEIQLQGPAQVTISASTESSKYNQDLAPIDDGEDVQLQASSRRESDSLITTSLAVGFAGHPRPFADGDAWLHRRRGSSWPSPAHAGAGAGGWPSAPPSMPPGAAASGPVGDKPRRDTRDLPPCYSAAHSAAPEPLSCAAAESRRFGRAHWPGGALPEDPSHRQPRCQLPRPQLGGGPSLPGPLEFPQAPFSSATPFPAAVPDAPGPGGGQGPGARQGGDHAPWIQRDLAQARGRPDPDPWAGLGQQFLLGPGLGATSLPQGQTRSTYLPQCRTAGGWEAPIGGASSETHARWPAPSLSLLSPPPAWVPYCDPAGQEAALASSMDGDGGAGACAAQCFFGATQALQCGRRPRPAPDAGGA